MQGVPARPDPGQVASSPRQTETSSTGKKVGYLAAGAALTPIAMVAGPIAAVAGAVKRGVGEIKLGLMKSKLTQLKKAENMKPDPSVTPSDCKKLGAEHATLATNPKISELEAKIKYQELKNDRRTQTVVAAALSAVPFLGLAAAAAYLSGSNKPVSFAGRENKFEDAVAALGGKITSNVTFGLLTGFAGGALFGRASNEKLHAPKSREAIEKQVRLENDQKNYMWSEEEIQQKVAERVNLGSQGPKIEGLTTRNIGVEREAGKSTGLAIFTSGEINPQKPTIVIFHGNGNKPADMQLKINDMKATHNVVVASYGGFPENNDGVETDEASMTQDANAIMKFLSDQGVTKDVELYGYSLGCHCACSAAAVRPDMVSKVSLLAPFTSMADAIGNCSAHMVGIPRTVGRAIGEAAVAKKGKPIHGVKNPDGTPFVRDGGSNLEKLKKLREQGRDFSLKVVDYDQDWVMGFSRGVNESGRSVYTDSFPARIAASVPDCERISKYGEHSEGCATVFRHLAPEEAKIKEEEDRKAFEEKYRHLDLSDL